MSKQYMDFAPRKAAGATSARGVAGAKSTSVRGATRTKPTSVSGVKGVKPTPSRNVARHSVSGVRLAGTTAIKPSVGIAKPAVKSTSRAVQKSTLSVKNEPTLGVIEDLNPKFVKTDVPKRPLSQASHFNTAKTGVSAVKARKIGVRGTSPVENPVENSRKTGDKGIYSPPKSPFINQGKVQKRPLSKNVYQKKIVVPKEEPKGPVTIISKPEKQAHVGLIVTIILTIILGAAAGTVAFLLLPK